ncbi:MAG: hypothetical protein WA637_04500, partial [Terriglobales bacterium]
RQAGKFLVVRLQHAGSFVPKSVKNARPEGSSIIGEAGAGARQAGFVFTAVSRLHLGHYPNQRNN